MSFQFQIFRELIKNSERGQNLMISSLSIYHILSLAANGASYKTLKEMIKALNNKNLDEINEVNKLINSQIENFKSVEIANAIFTLYNQSEFEKNFMNQVKKYKALVDKMENPEKINKWCKEATNGKITKIIDKFEDDMKLILINAIYFKGIWEKQFDKNKTKKKEFINYKKEKKLVDFMNINDKFYTYEGNNIQCLSLNYKNDNMKALIILPIDEYDINKFIQNFTMDDYKNILLNLTEEKVYLSIPKFEINFKCELKDILTNMGMKKAFSDDADFSSMLNKNEIKIDDLIHKAYIKVDEEGTEASAITEVKFKRKTKLKTPIMIVDHPFLFIIRNNNLPLTHDILFISKIEDFKDNTIKNSDTDLNINKAQNMQLNNQINNNINLLDFNDNIQNNNNTNNVNLLEDVFQNNGNNNNQTNSSNLNNEINNIFLNVPQNNNNITNNNSNFNFINTPYSNNNIQNSNQNQFNIEQVYKNIGHIKQDKKSNDPFNFIDDLMKKK